MLRAGASAARVALRVGAHRMPPSFAAPTAQVALVSRWSAHSSGLSRNFTGAAIKKLMAEGKFDSILVAAFLILVSLHRLRENGEALVEKEEATAREAELEARLEALKTEVRAAVREASPVAAASLSLFGGSRNAEAIEQEGPYVPAVDIWTHTPPQLVPQRGGGTVRKSMV
ncbi:hypothetical protein T484DRAFT_1896012 [Baffinella frigidus]|nr:hypothetical protein T484DRAFT_1896012 [Cryptophyta sp. CCMP2293]